MTDVVKKLLKGLEESKRVNKNYQKVMSRKKGKKMIDIEIKPLIDILNAAGIKTVASCCGHDKMFPNVALADGREIMILPNHTMARRVEGLLIGIGICKPINECNPAKDENAKLKK